MATARGMERVRPPDLPARARRDGPRRCLVTGGAGFIGAYVLRALLESGREVCGYDVADLAPEGRFVLGTRAAEARVERGSIDDEARLFDVVAAFDPDEIVHLATVIDPAYLVRHRSSALRINVGGTINVLEAMRLFGVERLVNISSIGVLPPIQYEPVDARHPVLLADSGPGTDFYGAAKVASEAFCFAYRGALGIDFRTVRPSAVYGVGMNRFPGPIKDMVEATVRGETLRLATGGPHPRDYTHAADVASLIVALLGAPDDADRIFYGATGRPLVTGTELAGIVADVLPGADIEIGDELSEAERSVVALRGQLSVENSRTQLGWEPRYGDVRDGVAAYAEEYRGFLAASGAGGA